MKSIYSFLCILCIPFSICAQETSVSTDHISGLITKYQEESVSHAAIYTGKEHMKYPLYYKEHPFLVSDKYATGTLMYDNVFYPEVHLKLDYYTNELVLNTPGGHYNIVLSPDRFQYATLHGYYLIYHQRDNRPASPPTGYYAQLYEGTYGIMKRLVVELQETITNTQLSYTFKTGMRFYVLKGDRFYSANSQGALLNIFKDKKRELKQFIRSNHLNFNQDPDRFLIEVVKQYEKITQ
ncbi:MAG: hypothetical protein LUG98_08395 [Tannerellaceae bacterium]|nr:hypothetical protein [Tannerellaceae bacterium]